MLEAAQRESDDLRARLEEVTGLLTLDPDQRPAESATYVITDAGDPQRGLSVPHEEPVVVPDRLVLTATVGVPLVKAAALGHGLRRAFSAESRNRIWFEVRREVRASRKRMPKTTARKSSRGWWRATSRCCGDLKGGAHFRLGFRS